MEPGQDDCTYWSDIPGSHPLLEKDCLPPDDTILLLCVSAPTKLQAGRFMHRSHGSAVPVALFTMSRTYTSCPNQTLYAVHRRHDSTEIRTQLV